MANVVGAECDDGIAGSIGVEVDGVAGLLHRKVNNDGIVNRGQGSYRSMSGVYAGEDDGAEVAVWQTSEDAVVVVDTDIAVADCYSGC